MNAVIKSLRENTSNLAERKVGNTYGKATFLGFKHIFELPQDSEFETIYKKC